MIAYLNLSNHSFTYGRTEYFLTEYRRLCIKTYVFLYSIPIYKPKHIDHVKNKCRYMVSHLFRCEAPFDLVHGGLRFGGTRAGGTYPVRDHAPNPSMGNRPSSGACQTFQVQHPGTKRNSDVCFQKGTGLRFVLGGSRTAIPSSYRSRAASQPGASP